MKPGTQAIILKRTFLYLCIFAPLFLFARSLLIAKTHLTVMECGAIAIIIASPPASFAVQFLLAPWFGWNIPTRPKART